MKALKLCLRSSCPTKIAQKSFHGDLRQQNLLKENSDAQGKPLFSVMIFLRFLSHGVSLRRSLFEKYVSLTKLKACLALTKISNEYFKKRHEGLFLKP